MYLRGVVRHGRLAAYQVAGFTPDGTLSFAPSPSVEPGALFTPPPPPKKKPGLLGAYISSTFPLPTVSGFGPGAQYLSPGQGATLIVSPVDRPTMQGGTIRVGSKKKVRRTCACHGGSPRTRRTLGRYRNSLRGFGLARLGQDDGEVPLEISTLPDSITAPLPPDIPTIMSSEPNQIAYDTAPPLFTSAGFGSNTNFVTNSQGNTSYVSGSGGAGTSALASGIGTALSSLFKQGGVLSNLGGQQVATIGGIPVNYLLYGVLGLAGVAVVFSLLK